MDYKTWKLHQLKAELKRRKADTTGNKAELVERLLDCDDVRTDKVVQDEAQPQSIQPQQSTQRIYDYGTWTLPQLREELKRRKAKTIGNKTALVERLQAYDRNNNFTDGNDIVPLEQLQFKLQWPADDEYRSVSDRSVVPHISLVDIERHFFKVYKHGAGMTECEAAHRKAFNMMEQEFLRALTETEENFHHFYKGQVNSEYTKSLTYFVRLALNSEGNIAQCQCECEAGAGPYAACKHVGVLCYALLYFKQNSKWPIKLTVTQKPQTWHVPKKKKMGVSPMKAEQVTYEIGEYQKVKKRKPNCLIYDPRPKDRVASSFPDNIRNAAINVANSGTRPFGLSGVFQCASTAGFVKDHDYLKDSLDTQIVKNFCKVTAESAKLIEEKTRKQSKSKEWFWERSIRITASKVGEICYFTDKRDKGKYAEDIVSGKQTCPTAAMLWGTKNEAVAVKAYEEVSHNTVRKCGLFISEIYPFLAASPDGLVAALTVLEVKCPYSIRSEKITPKNYPHLKLSDSGNLTLKRSSKYFYQCQLQMFVTDRQHCEFFVWTTCDSVLVQLEIDLEVVQEIIKKTKDFYDNFVVPELKKKWFPLF